MTAKREITKPIWLFLLRERGRWTSAGLAAQLHVDGDVIFASMRQMWDRRMVKRHDTKPLTYEVDGSCRVPDNVTVFDLIQAGFTPPGALE